jgi:hypothetical protein
MNADFSLQWRCDYCGLAELVFECRLAAAELVPSA